MSDEHRSNQTATLARLAFVLVFAGAAAALVWRLTSAPTGPDDAAWLGGLAAVAAGAALLAAFRRSGPGAQAWIAVALGCMAWGASHPVRLDDDGALALVANASFIVMTISFSVSLVLALGIAPDRAGLVKLLIDMIPPVIAVATAAWLFIIGPFVIGAASAPAVRVTAAVHGVSGAALLVVAVGSFLSRRRSAMWIDGQLLLVGLCVVALADVVRMQQLIGALPGTLVLANVIFAAGFGLLVLAALVSRFRGVSLGNEPADRAIAAWESQIPNLALVAMLLLGLVQAIAGEIVRFGLPVTLGSALVMLLLVMARQSIVLRRDRHLRTEIGALSEQIDGLMLQVGRDPLTGLLNHRAVHERLDHELAIGRTNGLPVAVVLIDVDNFKTVNDTLGHQAGDRVLRAIAGILTAASRGSDVAARYAGDEFMLLLPGLDEAHAGSVCNRIADEVRRVNRELNLGDGVRVSLSVGVAVTHRCQRSVSQTVAIADAAMYDAKETGKDQVVVVNADTLVIAEFHDGERPIEAMVAARRAALESSVQVERRRAS